MVRFRWIAPAILALTTLIFSPLPALAQKRVALVVGIDAYTNLEPTAQLFKAVEDSKAIATTLRALDFDVIHKENVTRTQFNEAWQELLDKLVPGDTAAFYFAGHGVELGGSYLLPKDVPNLRPGREELLKRESLSLQEFLSDLRDKGTRLNLVIVDACRDNPFIQLAGRSVGRKRGLTATEPAKGTFIMYSAGQGESALDGLPPPDPDPNSVYTRTLLPLLNTRGLTLTEIAEQVQEKVDKLALSVKHKQTPAFYSQGVGRVCLAGCEKPTPTATAAKSGLVNLMSACVKQSIHPATDEIAERLARELVTADRYYGWYDDPDPKANAAGKHVQVQKLLEAAAVSDGLKLRYDWQNGYLLLKVVEPPTPYGATRSVVKRGDPAPKFGTWLQGIWVQDNGYGCVDLRIDPTGEAEGQWSVKQGVLDNKIFLSKKKP